jgi:Rrf2 family protein
MQITRQSEYAIRTMLELAQRPSGEIVSSKVISENQDIPEDFLKKTIQLLAVNQLVTTHRGTHGGVRLARPIDKITIADIIVAIEGPFAINPCLNPGYDCKNLLTCPVHRTLARAQSKFVEELSRQTLADLIDEYHKLKANKT